MRGRRFLVPEVVQTSAMDCGPACLKSLLDGFGIPVNYERLREICHVDLDGTSINTLEHVANELGLNAEQIMVPLDHLDLPEANILPAVVVVRLPNSFTHFVIVWAQYSQQLQVMDPAHGRKWSGARGFLENVHVHTQAVNAGDWREWAGSEEFVRPLKRRIRRLNVSRWRTQRLIESALEDSHWRGLAALDAAVRMMDPMVRAGGLRSDRTAGSLLEQFVDRARSSSEKPFHVIPPGYWSVLPARGYREEEPTLVFRGAVVLRIRGKRPSAATETEPAPTNNLRKTVCQTVAGSMSQIVEYLRRDGILRLATVTGVVLLSSLAMLLEALLFRSFLDFNGMLGLPQQRLGAAAMIVTFLGMMFLLDVAIARSLLGFGRRLETRVRAHILYALPRLSDRYFGSRLISDMAERSHSIHEIRLLPRLGGQLIRSSADLVLTTLGVIWLNPSIAPIAIVSMLCAIILPLAAQPFLADRDLRFRTHTGSLCSFYLDALRGLVPISAHSSGRAVRREHEALLTTWAQAGSSLQGAGVALEGLGMLISFGLTAWLLFSHISGPFESSVGLLLIYWAMSIPALGGQVSQLVWQYPRLHNLARRVLEPVASAATTDAAASDPSDAIPAAANHSNAGVSLVFDDVSVCATNQFILKDVNLTVEAGNHLCIVGASGAGKSSLVGLLLGWNRTATGSIHVDGVPLDATVLEFLRQHTAWVDPGIQIWNRSLLENLRYGTQPDHIPPLGETMEHAGLRGLLSSLPAGLQTQLGEGGALVSGGEGQRVRLGRAMMRCSPKLVILDEAFSGLDRESRRSLLLGVRHMWQGTTLLCVTHDVSDSTTFDRVIVMDHGRIVEDGPPATLLHRKDSLYRELVAAEQAVREQIWSHKSWRRIRLEDGQLTEAANEEAHHRKHPDDLLAGIKAG